MLFEFWATNFWDITLKAKLQLAARYELATEDEMKLYPYEAFYKRFPNSYGVLTFSRVAFNRLSHVNELAFTAQSAQVLRVKECFCQIAAGKWTVENTAGTWIS